MIQRTLKAVWGKWKIIAHTIGDFQSRVFLSVFYFVFLGPFALGVKAFSDPLRLHPKKVTGWLMRPHVEGDTLTQARRQY